MMYLNNILQSFYHYCFFSFYLLLTWIKWRQINEHNELIICVFPTCRNKLAVSKRFNIILIFNFSALSLLQKMFLQWNHLPHFLTFAINWTLVSCIRRSDVRGDEEVFCLALLFNDSVCRCFTVVLGLGIFDIHSKISLQWRRVSWAVKQIRSLFWSKHIFFELLLLLTLTKN